MAYPDSFVEEVRRTADVVRYISEHVSLKKMGTSWKGLCPFHQEKTPSFNVRAEPPLFHCFGCGEGGDVFKFVMLHERVNFPEAVATVARRFGIPVPESRFEPGPGRKEREEILELMEAAAQHFTRNLWTAPGRAAREYLLGRGFKKETLETIRAGAAPDSWSDLLDHLRPKFPASALLAGGLVLEKQSGGGHYDRFRNRAIFPILNESGKVIAFGARSLDGSDPKYLNSPETPVYQKSRTLYGLSWAKDAIRREGRVVLMEGYLDVARALEAGGGEAVATCGTALTAGHGRLLHRFTEEVVVNFDQDEAGQKAALKSFETLVEEGLKVRVVELPPGHDPDSYLKAEGAEAYRARLGEAPLYMEWLIRKAARENDLQTPPGKAAYLNMLLPALARLESAVERAAWLPVIAERGALDERATSQELRRAMAGRTTAGAVAASAPPARVELVPAEKLLLARILRGAEGVDEALAELAESDLESLHGREALWAAKKVYLRGEPVDAARLEAEVESEETRRMLREIAVTDSPAADQGPRECVLELRHLALKRRLAEIQKGIPAASGESLDALLQQTNEIKRQITSL